MPTFNSKDVEDYLRSFFDVLTRLERLGTKMFDSTSNNVVLTNQVLQSMNQQNQVSTNAQDGLYGGGQLYSPSVAGFGDAAMINTGLDMSGMSQGQYNTGPPPLVGLQQSPQMVQYNPGKYQDQIEEEELNEWASLRDVQQKFVSQYHGYLGSL